MLGSFGGSERFEKLKDTGLLFVYVYIYVNSRVYVYCICVFWCFENFDDKIRIIEDLGGRWKKKGCQAMCWGVSEKKKKTKIPKRLFHHCTFSCLTARKKFPQFFFF